MVTNGRPRGRNIRKETERETYDKSRKRKKKGRELREKRGWNGWEIEKEKSEWSET
jgi:ribosomal protein S4